ncbi:MAG: hypothetical protein QXO75_08440 [Nitrososphaerota archaeon]
MLALEKIDLLVFVDSLFQVFVYSEYSKLRIPFNNTSNNKLFQFVLDVIGENAGKVEILLFQNGILFTQSIGKPDDEEQDL